MFKKINKYIIFLIMFLIFPLTISSVECQWIYFDGPVKSVTLPDIKVSIKDFTYYPHEFPDTPEGQENKDVVDSIIGNTTKPDDPNNEHSLSDPNSEINDALSIGQIIVTYNRRYILSDDYIEATSGPNKGQYVQVSTLLGIPSDTKFVIYRQSLEIKPKQYYDIYSTKEDLSKYKEGSLIYPVFKTSLLWTEGATENVGTYKILESKIGTAQVKTYKTKPNRFSSSVKNIDFSNFNAQFYGDSLNNPYDVYTGENIICYNKNLDANNPVYLVFENPKKQYTRFRVAKGDSNATITILDESGNNISSGYIKNGKNGSKDVTIYSSKTKIFYVKVTGLNTEVEIIKTNK